MNKVKNLFVLCLVVLKEITTMLREENFFLEQFLKCDSIFLKYDSFSVEMSNRLRPRSRQMSQPPNSVTK